MSTRSICWRSARIPTTSRSASAALVAKHAALGHRVGLCDLTAGEMGSNGTVEERLAEAEAAREVLGARWRVNLRLPDRGIGSDPAPLDERRASRQAGAAARRGRAVLVDRHPDHVAASQLLTEACSTPGCAATRPRASAWKPEWVCYYFINDSAPPSFVVDVSDDYETKRRALACHVTQFRPRPRGAVATRLTSARFHS